MTPATLARLPRLARRTLDEVTEALARRMAHRAVVDQAAAALSEACGHSDVWLALRAAGTALGARRVRLDVGGERHGTAGDLPGAHLELTRHPIAGTPAAAALVLEWDGVVIDRELVGTAEALCLRAAEALRRIERERARPLPVWPGDAWRRPAEAWLRIRDR